MAGGNGGAPKILVVVESPAKCRTIQKYLGSQYVVRASLGHVRDLPVGKGRRGKRGSSGGLGVDTGGWRGEWVVPKEKAGTVKGLRQLAGRRNPVVLATDCDREGEAIAWHLREVLGGRADRFVRVTFNEITRLAIRKAFHAPGRLDMALVRAQLARRFVDRLVGWRVSPALARAIGEARSAGRVQSVALRLVVERERSIRSFRAEPYWEVGVRVPGVELWVTRPAEGARERKGAHRFSTAAEAESAAASIRAAGRVRVTSVRSVPGVRKPYPPFVTASLQQAASSRLKFGVKHTMALAQSLYEEGLITYMRTDSVRLAPEAVEAIRCGIRDVHGAEYVPRSPNVFKVSGDAQEAHEAIRPTRFGERPVLEGDRAALYDLIERRAQQSQMAPARVRRDSVEGEAGGWRLGVSGVVVEFDGFERVWPPSDRDEVAVPAMEVDAGYPVEGVRAVAKRTKAPKRFTEASLVAELEERGIGRPSTYAATVGVLVERGYVEVRRRDLVATDVGDKAVSWLLSHFKWLLDYGFTAGLEVELDEVARGARDWKGLLDAFDRRLARQIEGAV